MSCRPLILAFVSLALATACGQADPDVHASKAVAIEGLGPVPEPEPDERQMVWRWAGNQSLGLWRPDPSRPSWGEWAVILRCEDDELVVDTDLITMVDVPIGGPPNVFRLEGGGVVITAPMDARGSYTQWAAGRFRPTKADLAQLLRSEFIVARPLWVGDAAAYALRGDGSARRHPSPPELLVSGLLQSCSGLVP